MQLFTPFRLGTLELNNRIVMAPMTRSRALGGVPNDLMRSYYQARATAGLIITEGVAPSPNGLGYARTPGLFSDQQVSAFRSVTDAVHEAGGRIFAQLMHVGRISHPLNWPEKARVVAPSAVRGEGMMWTDLEGPRPMVEPEALSSADLAATREEFVQAAKNARRAGFDGVELHSANGYLLNQFLHAHTNRRTDEYGGSVERRARFVIEVAQATAEALGADRVGVRLSPHGTFNDLPEVSQEQEQLVSVARSLNGLAYLHVIQNPHASFEATRAKMRAAYTGPMILAAGFDQNKAEAALLEGRAELISFGRPFIANPDLVTRFQRQQALATPDPGTFYTSDAAGYTDYPTFA